MTFRLPTLQTSDDILNTAFRIAMGDLVSNIALHDRQPLLNAGLDYPNPWVRDTAINIWNGVSLVFPEVMQNNLLSLIDEHDLVNPQGQFEQYWDVVIRSLGAWWHYLYTGDRDFLALAYRITQNTLSHYEVTEFDPQRNLFRSPAVYGDGIAGYPDHYVVNDRVSAILEWRDHNPDKRVPIGYGIPMFALSTNCLYAEIYRIQARMAAVLGAPDTQSLTKAERLKTAINRLFWDSETERYFYLIDDEGGCDAQEGLGNSFVLLFGIANEKQATSVLDNQPITPAGIPCVYPGFQRYRARGGYGRHSGTVWGHIQGLWGHAAIERGRDDLFRSEMLHLAERAVRDGQFAELFHPDTGKIYGGLQEGGKGDDGFQWKSCTRQTWSASAFLRLVLVGLCGMQVEGDNIIFSPRTEGYGMPLRLDGLIFQGQSFHIDSTGQSQ